MSDRRLIKASLKRFNGTPLEEHPNSPITLA